MKRTVFLVILKLSIIFMPNIGMADQQQGTLKQCTALKKEIEYYTDQRRSGGSAQEMERWKKARRSLESEFHKLKCRKHGVIRT